MRPWLRLAWVLGLAGASAGCSLFGGLEVEALSASAQKPSNVAVYVAVSDGDEPVTGLEQKNFRVYENGQLLSPQQIERVLLPREAVTEERVLLLVDLSGNPDAEQRERLVQATEAFVRKIALSVRVGVRAYDGGPELKSVGDYPRGTANPSAGALLRLKGSDASRNLNGAVVAALAELDRAARSAGKPVTIGTLVVFARGPDLAGRTSEDRLYEALGESEHDVIGVGVGEDTPFLDFARAGVIRSQDAETLPIAFEEAGSRVAKTHAKYYLVAYCSPARGGQRSVRVEAWYTDEDGDEKSGGADYEFDATGFGPGCNPLSTPRFESARPKAAEPGPARVNQSNEPADGVAPPPPSSDYAK
ncbi:MAG TPA: hypothetical protein VGK73_19675 [Polyangiaceae bacterium]